MQSEVLKAVLHGDLAAFESALLKASVPALDENRDEFGRNALHVSASNGYVRCVEALLEARAAVDLGVTTNGMTALHLAADSSHAAVLRVLLSYGANVNAKNSLDREPVQYCVSDPACLSVLAGWGARLDVVNFYGYTPLACALRDGHQDSARVLLLYGAKLNLVRAGLRIPAWVRQTTDQLNNCRRAIVAMVGVLRKRSGSWNTAYRFPKDVAGMLASLVWATRGEDPWKGSTTKASKKVTRK